MTLSTAISARAKYINDHVIYENIITFISLKLQCLMLHSCYKGYIPQDPIPSGKLHLHIIITYIITKTVSNFVVILSIYIERSTKYLT